MYLLPLKAWKKFFGGREKKNPAKLINDFHVIILIMSNIKTSCNK
jgi:hypothetical protein